jgi:DNA-binding transcriptional regulator YiaG
MASKQPETTPAPPAPDTNASTSQPDDATLVRHYVSGVRVRHNLTQSDLAAFLGTTVTTVSRWETGTASVRHPRILALALKALDAELTKVDRAHAAQG